MSGFDLQSKTDFLFMLYLYKVNLLNIQMEKNNYPGSMKFVLKIKKLYFIWLTEMCVKYDGQF